jgi:outer membrane protein TolC
MKQFYRLVIVIVSCWGTARAQDRPSTAFTLQQCLDYALKNSITMQNMAIDEQIAQSKVKETIGIGLPQINGSINATSNPTLPRFFGVKQRLFGFSGLPASEYPNFFPQLGDNDVLASQNFFQLKNSLNASLSVNQLIFNGSYLVGLHASSAFKNLAYKSTNQTKEQTIEQVTKAFYSALINQERIQLFTNNIARVDTLLRNTSVLNKNGFAEEIDVDRVQVTQNNLVTEKDKFERLQTLSLELLKFQMNFPMDQPLVLLGKIDDISTNVNLDEYLKEWDYKNRPDVQVLEANRELQRLNVRNKYAAALPVLSANANLGYSKQATSFGNLFSNGPDFAEMQGVGPDKLYPFSSVGITLSIPIFTGLQNSYQLQQEKLRLKKIDNTYNMLKSSIDLSVKQSVTAYENSLESLEAQKKNMKLAEKVARVTKIKYNQGVGSSLEVVEAESALKEAQVNYYNALYDVLVAKVDIDKAFGKILSNQNTQK